MQTRLAPALLETPVGRVADTILRSCVHCGFCNATCPTYRLLGDERDGPRGRIYLIKQVLEGDTPTRRTQRHLDRCLTCLACETTCPSGVRYGQLAEIGRHLVVQHVRRPTLARLQRWLLLRVLSRKNRFAIALGLGRAVRGLLPRHLRSRIPSAEKLPPWPNRVHERRILLLEGCVQPLLAPRTDLAAARLLDRHGISLVRAGGGCCGALAHHLGAAADTRAAMRRNIDAWWPHIGAGAEAVVATASACSLQLKDYGRLLADDPEYRDKAARISELARDVAEVVHANIKHLPPVGRGRRVAFHPPCTLQHGLRLRHVVEELLTAAGYELVPVPDAHICCGSAGTYSILEADLAGQLRDAKLAALSLHAPDVIATANVGCQHHLQSGAGIPVRHWIELLESHA